MKLISSTLLLVAGVFAENFKLNTENVRGLNAQLQDLFDRKFSEKLQSYQSKTKAATANLNDFAASFDINEYNAQAESCTIQSADFWNKCKQCTAQQCTEYMANSCDNPNDPRLAMLIANQLPNNNPNIIELRDFFIKLTAMGVQAKVSSENDGDVMSMTLPEYLDIVTNNNLRKKRAADVTCVDGDIQILGSQDMKVNSAETVVSCSDTPLPASLKSQDFEHLADAESENGSWKINAGSSHMFSLAMETMADGQVVVDIQISAADADAPAPLPDFEGDFGDYGARVDPDAMYGKDIFFDNYSQDSYSNGCDNPAGCDNMGGNNEWSEERLFMQDEAKAVICDGVNGGPDCVNVDMISSDFNQADEPNPEKPCTEEEAGYMSQGQTIQTDNVSKLDMSDEEFCLSIGKSEDCMYEVPFRRRSSGKRRRASTKAKASCEELETTPIRCLDLKLSCDSCNEQISYQCPSYHALRSELSSKINTASKLVEQFSNSIMNDVDEMKWYIAVDQKPTPSIYVQHAAYDPISETATLLIHTGTADQAQNVLVRSKFKSDTEFDSFSENLINVFDEQEILDLIANAE